MDEFLIIFTGGAIWGAGFAVAFGAVQLAGASVRLTARTAVKGVAAAGGRAKALAAGALESGQELYAEAKEERTPRR